MAREQEQFLDVVDRDTAERRWWQWLRPSVLTAEEVPLSKALGRVLAVDVVAGIDVPGFDRANVDGFAVVAAQTYGAAEESPRRLRLSAEELATGVVPRLPIAPGTATAIATGGMLPRGADAVVMVEHTALGNDGTEVLVHRPIAPGAGVTFAGTDMARGELVLRKGIRLSARETGVLAAIGRGTVAVVRRPRVAIVSTGDEIIAPGVPIAPGMVYDANATLLADAVRELGGEPVPLGIVGDDPAALDSALDQGLACDVVLLSGGTSKGAGDLSYRVLAQRSPGILVHGVALKPGKPICLGAVGSTPVAILPGFPTSAIFTFHEFIAPILRHLGGARTEARETLSARMPVRINSEIGRTEYLLVNLVHGHEGLAAYPLGKGSGSVTTFSTADGFVVIPREREYLDAGEAVKVIPLGQGTAPADLVCIGSHCVGLDYLLGALNEQGHSVKTIWVGSQGGLIAVGRGECDIAGIHLLDPETGTFNRAFLPPGVLLVRGYDRMQGIVYRAGDRRFEGVTVAEAIAAAVDDPGCVMVNRNRGSGTRILNDRLLAGHKPPGYAIEARSHNAVAAAVAQCRADWGLAIEPVTAAYQGLAFLPVQVEQYDFAIPADRWDRPAVRAFRALFERPAIVAALAARGFPRPDEVH
jgi:putative molybdopterin biosynthesis protein